MQQKQNGLAPSLASQALQIETTYRQHALHVQQDADRRHAETKAKEKARQIETEQRRQILIQQKRALAAVKMGYCQETSTSAPLPTAVPVVVPQHATLVKENIDAHRHNDSIESVNNVTETVPKQVTNTH